MEVTGTYLFQRSEHNRIPVRYLNFLGDGDNKAYCVVAAKPYKEEVSITKF